MIRFFMIAALFVPSTAGAADIISDAGATVAEVPDQISSPAEAFDVATLAIDAFKKKRYGVFTGFLLMLMVFGARRLRAFKNVPKEWSPWIACGLGILFSIGTVFAAGRPPVTAITHGFVLGAAATGLWEMVGKYFLPPPRA